jgi:hypothetical protein
MRFKAEVDKELAISRGASGSKLSVCYFTKGSFDGPRLRGELLPGGGDWAAYENQDHLEIDVRGVLRTDDGALIYMKYRGLWRAVPGALPRVLAIGGEKLFKASEHYLRIAARFETDHPHYAWLNGIIAVGIGERTANGAGFDFYELE